MSQPLTERERTLADRVAELERELAALRGDDAAPADVEHNLEGNDDFTVRWQWDHDGTAEAGFTAVVRVKNEAGPLPWVLPPLLRAVRRVVVVDNGSTDGTPDVARATAAASGSAERLDVVEYPFSVSRCGPEHLHTPPDSVHSLTYFYNWSFAHVRTRYALKWDGDMVLTDSGVEALRDLEWQLETTHRVITMMRYPLYVADDSTAFLDVSVHNRESWGWPNTPGYRHTKAFEWELPRWGDRPTMLSLPDWSCVELKHLDADEFAHWSVEDFTVSGRTTRKQREWQVFQSLAEGSDPPYGVVRIDAPVGQHVIDHVRTTYLPDNSDELAKLHRKVVLSLAIRPR